MPNKTLTLSAIFCVLAFSYGCGGSQISGDSLLKKSVEDIVNPDLSAFQVMSPVTTQGRGYGSPNFEIGQRIPLPEFSLWQKITAFEPHTGNNELYNTPDRLDYDVTIGEGSEEPVGTGKQRYLHHGTWWKSEDSVSIVKGEWSGFERSIIISGELDFSRFSILEKHVEPKKGHTWTKHFTNDGDLQRWRGGFANVSGLEFQVAGLQGETETKNTFTHRDQREWEVIDHQSGSGSLTIKMPGKEDFPATATWDSSGNGTIKFASGKEFLIKKTYDSIDVL